MRRANCDMEGERKSGGRGESVGKGEGSSAGDDEGPGDVPAWKRMWRIDQAMQICMEDRVDGLRGDAWCWSGDEKAFCSFLVKYYWLLFSNRIVYVHACLLCTCTVDNPTGDLQRMQGLTAVLRVYIEVYDPCC